MAKVIENLVPEARVEKVQDGVLLTSDVEVDEGVVVAPVALGVRRDKMFGIPWITITQVIPARPGPLRHGVGFAGVLLRVVDPVGRVQERTTWIAGGFKVLHLRLE